MRPPSLRLYPNCRCPNRRRRRRCENAVLLERIPLGVLIYRQDTLLYANRYFLELSGYRDLDALTTAGGLHALFAEPEPGTLAQSGGTESLSVMTCDGERRPVEGRLFSIPFGEASALALILSNGVAEERRRAMRFRSRPPRAKFANSEPGLNCSNAAKTNCATPPARRRRRRQPRPSLSAKSATKSARRSTP